MLVFIFLCFRKTTEQFENLPHYDGQEKDSRKVLQNHFCFYINNFFSYCINFVLMFIVTTLHRFLLIFFCMFSYVVGSVVEWLNAELETTTVSVQNPLAPFCCVLGKDTLRHIPCLVVLASSSKLYISTKLQADSNILASPEAGRGNCLPYVLAPPSFSFESGG